MASAFAFFSASFAWYLASSSSKFRQSLYDLWADIDSLLRVEHIRAFDEANGAIKVVERWLKYGCKEPVDTMAKLLTQYVTPYYDKMLFYMRQETSELMYD